MRRILLFAFVYLALAAMTINAFAAAGSEDLVLDSGTRRVLNPSADFRNVALTLGNFTMSDSVSARIITLGTMNGTKFGATTTDKLSFYGAAPVIRPTGSVLDALTSLNLVGSPTINFSELSAKPTTLAGYGVTDGQPLDSDLTAIAALTTTSYGRSLLTAADAPALLTLAGAASSSHTHTFASLTSKPTTLSGFGITDAQPLDGDLTAIAALSTTSYGRGVLALADGAALLSYASAQPLDADLTSIAALATTTFGRNLLTTADATALANAHSHSFSSLTSKPTTLAGYGITDNTFANLLSKPTTLSGYGITDAQPLDSDLTSIAALSTTSFGRGLLTLADAAALSGAHTHAFASLTSKPTTLSGYGLTDAQPLDSDLTAIAALATTSFGRGTLALADAPAFRSYIGALGSGHVIYASSVATLNSNVLTGGGTDATSALNTALATIASAGGGELILDGAALISGPLYVGNNTTIRALDDHCGVYLANFSSTHMLKNALNTTDPYPARPGTYNKNITIIGGTWNGNFTNQFKSVANSGANAWVCGFFFSGVDNLSIRNVTIYEARNFAIFAAYANNLTIENYTARWASYHVAENNDSIHLWGPSLGTTYVRNLRSFNGSDDVLALNFTESKDFNGGTLFSVDAGAVNTVIDGVYAENCAGFLRFDGIYASAGKLTVSNASVKFGTGGPSTPIAGLLGSWDEVTLDNWNVEFPGSVSSTLASVVYTGSNANAVTTFSNWNYLGPETPVSDFALVTANSLGRRLVFDHIFARKPGAAVGALVRVLSPQGSPIETIDITNCDVSAAFSGMLYNEAVAGGVPHLRLANNNILATDVLLGTAPSNTLGSVGAVTVTGFPRPTGGQPLVAADATHAIWSDTISSLSSAGAQTALKLANPSGSYTTDTGVTQQFYTNGTATLLGVLDYALSGNSGANSYAAVYTRAADVVSEAARFGADKSLTVNGPLNANGGIAVPVWNAPTLANSWINFGSGSRPAGYRKTADGRVWLRGMIKSGTTTAGTTLFTLPSGYRPTTYEVYGVSSNDAFGEVQILTTGEVQIVAGSATFLSLGNISFATD